MFRLKIHTSFAAAHCLIHYQGDCENLHGHNFKVQVVLAGERLDDTGMLVDFIDVKNLMGQVLARLDHQNLNEVSPFDVKNPSAENIARYLYFELGRKLNNENITVDVVTVWESDFAGASYYE